MHELESEEANPIVGTCCDCNQEIRRNEEAYVDDDYNYICGSCMALRLKEMERRFEKATETEE